MSRIFEKYPGNGMVPLSVFSFSEFPPLKIFNNGYFYQREADRDIGLQPC